MRIAVVPTIRHFPWGAPGECMGALVEALLMQRHEVLCLVAPIDWEHPQVGRLTNMGAKTVKLPDPLPGYIRLRGLRRRWDTLTRWRSSLGEIHDDWKPDHVFVNQGGTWCGIQDEFFYCLADRPWRYSLISHLNQPMSPFSGELLMRARRLMSGAARVFFNSQWCHRLAEQQIATAIPAGRPFQVPLRFGFGEPLRWPNHSVPRLAMVNRLDTYHKGIDVALASVAQLRREGVVFHLSVYGAGNDEGYLRELVRFLDIESVVTFKGHVEQVETVWREEEMLLLPSRYEGLGVAMVEAMGFGRPVLRTPYGGGAEWMEDGLNGYLCEAAEVPLLCAALRRALSERVRWPEMGRRGHAKVRAVLLPDPAAVFLDALK